MQETIPKHTTEPRRGSLSAAITSSTPRRSCGSAYSFSESSSALPQASPGSGSSALVSREIKPRLATLQPQEGSSGGSTSPTSLSRPSRCWFSPSGPLIVSSVPDW